jgi:hypothetical protein
MIFLSSKKVVWKLHGLERKKQFMGQSFYLPEDWVGKWARSIVVAKIILSFLFVSSQDLKLIIIN